MILEDAPEEYRSDVRLLSNTYNGFTMNTYDFQTASIVPHYLPCDCN